MFYRCYFALSCPVSKQLLVYRQELNSSPLFNYSFSEAVLVPDFKKKYPELRIDLTLVNRNSVTIFIAASTEEDLFGWIKAFGNTGAKVCILILIYIPMYVLYVCIITCNYIETNLYF